MDFTKLIARLKKGNRKAQKELYDQFSPSMFSICLRYAKSKEDAEDIFQQAFIKTYAMILLCMPDINYINKISICVNKEYNYINIKLC